MRFGLLLSSALLLTGCDLSMTAQDRHDPQSSPTLWPGGPPVADAPQGSVARDQPARDVALATPPHLDAALLARGEERFRIHCAVCHGPTGMADGPIVQRGFPRPPRYTDARVMVLSPRQIVDVIGNGYGVMYGFGDRIAPADRWAIAAHVKTLQRAYAPAASR